MNGPQPICAGCGTATTLFKPVCDDCIRASGQTPINCVFCLSGHYPEIRHGLHYNDAGGYVGKCSDGAAK